MIWHVGYRNCIMIAGILNSIMLSTCEGKFLTVFRKPFSFAKRGRDTKHAPDLKDLYLQHISCLRKAANVHVCQIEKSRHSTFAGGHVCSFQNKTKHIFRCSCGIFAPLAKAYNAHTTSRPCFVYKVVSHCSVSMDSLSGNVRRTAGSPFH